jgi:hypothetical protein
MKKQYLSVSDLGRRGVDALISAPQHCSHGGSSPASSQAYDATKGANQFVVCHHGCNFIF